MTSVKLFPNKLKISRYQNSLTPLSLVLFIQCKVLKSFQSLTGTFDFTFEFCFFITPSYPRPNSHEAYISFVTGLQRNRTRHLIDWI